MSKETVAIQIRPTLVFTDIDGNLILDEKVGSLRRKLTKSWWNDKWLNRLLAAAAVITHAPRTSGDGLTLADQLLRIEAEKSLDETTLGQESTDEAEDDLSEVHIQDDDEREDEPQSA